MHSQENMIGVVKSLLSKVPESEKGKILIDGQSVVNGIEMIKSGL